MTLTRRAWLAGFAAGLPLWRLRGAARERNVDAIEDGLRALEARVGGRLGVALLDTGSEQRLAHRGSERFPMCSTFKLLAVAAVLARVDAGRDRLDRRVPYGEADLLGYAPVTRRHLGEGGLTIGELAAAAIERSDNTAANLLLAVLGGPAAVTRYVRTLGDPVTRLDRTEPTLNTAVPGDPRDTTTPAAMLDCMNTLLCRKHALSAASRERLTSWLVGCATGAARLRAGFPSGWRVGDKTGAGAHGTTNDVAIAWPPGGAPVLVTAYLTESAAPPKERDAALAQVARLLTQTA